MPNSSHPPMSSAGSTPPSTSAWLVFAVVLTADLLDMIDSTVTTVASPVIVRELSAPPSLVPWLGMSYALALGSLLVVGGRLGDRFGQRTTFLLGVTGFTLASLLCGLAWSAPGLVGFRLVQGAFGALLIPQGFSLLLAVFPREHLGRVFGLFGPMLAIGAIGGPVLAGVLIQADIAGSGWRSIFLINGAIGTLILVVAPRVLPHSTRDAGVVINATSCVLVMLGLLALIGGLIDGGDGGWHVRAISSVGAGLSLLAGFAWHERHTRGPLLAPGLFRLPSFVAGLVVGTVYFAAVTGLMYVVSLHLQQGAHLDTLHTALLMAPLSVGIILTSFTTRSRVQDWGRWLVLAGTLLTLAGVLGVMLAIHRAPHQPALLVIPLLVTGLGMGACFGSLFATALGEVEQHEAGSASGTLNALQQVANAAGAALGSTMFVHVSRTGGETQATTTTLVAVSVIVAAAVAATPLLPRHAAAEEH